LSRIALRRAETAADYGLATLDTIIGQGMVACDPASLQALRLHVYQRGAIKDIRNVDRSGGAVPAYSETLEFDNGWINRDAMLPTARQGVSLSRVEQFFGTALGLMRDVDSDRSIVAILGMSGVYSDVMLLASGVRRGQGYLVAPTVLLQSFTALFARSAGNGQSDLAATGVN
jgi:c-di-GMP phosphodiesterase